MNPNETRYISCELCGSSNRKIFPEKITSNRHVCICINCGHLYTGNPTSKEDLANYDKFAFTADPGASNFNDISIDQAEYSTSLKCLLNDVMPTVYKYVSPNNKKWLEIRFRTGAIFEILLERNAEIWGIDLFDKNVKNSKNLFSLPNLFASNVHNIFDPIKPTNYFDVISCLSIHLISHLPSPNDFLSKVKKYLKPNGYLIIEEKDIRKITSSESPHPLADPNPIAHYHHMTLDTTKAFIIKNGFRVLFGDYIPRESALKHFLIIAKPVLHAEESNLVLPFQDYKSIYDQMIKEFNKKEKIKN